MTTSNAAAVDKTEKTATEKAGEKLAEKRRALGRGLESLLPGPRVVPAAPTLPQSARKDGAPEGPGSHAADVRAKAGVAETPVAFPDAVPGTLEQLEASGQTPEGETVFILGIDQIARNPYQTRHEFDEEALQELARSIQVQGVLQPIMVRPGKEGRFVLILGERRLRASRIAGQPTIPAIVKRVSDQQAAEMTLVENLQRQQLNCVEQAEAFANLSTMFKLTQEEIGKRAGVSREQVSNYMRLLSLPEGVIGALQTGKLTYTHARTLLHLRNHEQIWKLAKRAIEEKMSVLKLEDLVLGVSGPSGSTAPPTQGGGARWVDPNVKSAQRSLEEALGMRVRIRDRGGRGKIVIEYATLDDFDQVVGMLRGK
jgi:ParB family chromosome partitioning protein